MNDWKEVAKLLREALVMQCHAHNKDVERGKLCWCGINYDFERFGHSVACAAAKEALQEMDKLEGRKQ